MATTTVSDAVVIPQAKGTGLGSEDDNVDAAAAALLSAYSGGEYVGQGMDFSGHDGTNDQVDIGAGYCFIKDDSSSTSGSRGSGGNAQIQSTSSSGYDTEIPNNQVYLVIFPTSVTIDVSDSTLNQIWVNITDVTSNNSVEVRSDGGGGTTSEPSDTYLKLGEANPDDSSADTRASEGWRILASLTHLTDSENEFTNTSFQNLTNENKISVAFDADRLLETPGVGSLATSHQVALLQQTDAGETTTIRSYDVTNDEELCRAEMEGSNFGPVAGPITPIDTTGVVKVKLDLKVTGGTGRRKGNSSLIVWGKPA